MENTVEMINIDDFPDEILTHILSFLPFKQAFRTTILSKRWRPLPLSLAVLDMNDYHVRGSTDWFHFRQFMNKLIFSPHSRHLPLTSFNLNCHSRHVLWESNYSIFDQWIKAAKQRHVKLLGLFFSSMIPMAPSTIFYCKTLVDLRLMNVSVEKMTPCSVDLPLLKDLYLSKVCFNDMEDLVRLIHGCPLLEILRTSFIKTFVKTSNGFAVGGGYLKPLSKLIKADIHLFNVPLTILSDVQSLTMFTVEMGEIMFHNEEIHSYYKDFPVFGNLINLQLSRFYRGIHYWDDVVEILENCPKLQTLLVAKGIDLITKEDWKYPDHVPECFSSHLTSCEIFGYESFGADFLFATYILQNARLLQVMTIRQTCRPKPFESSQYLQDLSSCQRISPKCKLNVYNSSCQRIYPLI